MDRRPSRRQYLLAVGGSLLSSGCSFGGEASHPQIENTTDSGSLRGNGGQTGEYAVASSDVEITFDRVVDAVADLGMDDTGTDPIDNALADALQSGTLIEFPPGDYRVGEQTHDVEGMDRFGIRGTGSDHRSVRFVPAEGLASRPIDAVTGAGSMLIENVTFDEREDERSQISLNLRSSGGSIVRDVEFVGRTPDDNGPRFGQTIVAGVTSVNGVCVYENVIAGIDAPAHPVTYPDGVGFLSDGEQHRGELIVRNPTIHRRNSSATNFRWNGVVTLEGGEFVNNQLVSLRFGAGTHPTKISTATGSYIKVDDSVTQASAAVQVSGTGEQAGAVFRDVHIDWTTQQGRGVIALVKFDPHGRAEFRNCVVRNDSSPNRIPTVYAAAVPEVKNDAIVIDDCSFIGSGGGFIARDRSGSVIRNSCIDMPNAAFRGFDTVNISTDGCPDLSNQ